MSTVLHRCNIRRGCRPQPGRATRRECRRPGRPKQGYPKGVQTPWAVDKMMTAQPVRTVQVWPAGVSVTVTPSVPSSSRSRSATGQSAAARAAARAVEQLLRAIGEGPRRRLPPTSRARSRPSRWSAWANVSNLAPGGISPSFSRLRRTRSAAGVSRSSSKAAAKSRDVLRAHRALGERAHSATRSRQRRSVRSAASRTVPGQVHLLAVAVLEEREPQRERVEPAVDDDRPAAPRCRWTSPSCGRRTAGARRAPSAGRPRGQ